MDHEHRDAKPGLQLEGRYSNCFKVGHNAFEFLIDFGQYYNGSEEPHLHTRIITSPLYAKELLEMLRGAIKEYEQQYGILPR